jgi:trimeric autotransporter adhesin
MSSRIYLSFFFCCFAYATGWAGSWQAFGGPGGCNGEVFASASLPDGDILVGGAFSRCGNVDAQSLARYSALTGQWRSMGSDRAHPSNGRVLAIAIDGSTIYVGGTFTQFAGVTTGAVARWDGTQWQGVGTIDALRQVKALSMFQGTLYAGAELSGAAEQPGLAHFNGSQWVATGGGIVTTLDPPLVNALSVHNGALYAAGAFARGSNQSNGIVRWNGTSYSSVSGQSSGSLLGLNGSANTLHSLNNVLYIGGEFVTVEGLTCNGVVAWDGGNYSALGTGVIGSGQSVRSLGSVGGLLVAVGQFRGPAGTLRNAAVFSGSAWNPIGVCTAADTNGVAQTVSSSNARLFVGGLFTRAGNVEVSNIAQNQNGNWTQLGNTPNFGLDREVSAIASIGNDIYVGGRFNASAQTALSKIARWDGSAWQALAQGIDNPNGGTYVNAIAVNGNDVYVGGSFSAASGVAANNIARWNGTAWQAIGAGSGINGLSGEINALAVGNNQLFVAGSFGFSAGGQNLVGVARFDPVSNQFFALGTGVSGINALHYFNGALYAGGQFKSAGGVSVDNLARWDGSSWTGVGSGQNQGVNSVVSSITNDGTDLIVGGEFTLAGTTAALGVARWNGSAWFGYAPLTTLGFPVRSLQIYSGKLYAGGDFGSNNGPFGRGIVRWNGSSWSALAGTNQIPGTSSNVRALHTTQDRLYLGGSFHVVGGELSSAIASWQDTGDTIFASGFELFSSRLRLSSSTVGFASAQ